MTGKTRYVVIFFMFVTFFTVLEMNVVLPLAPSIAEIYGIPLPYISLLNLGYSVMGLLAPIFGYYSDRYSIKRTLFISLLIFCLGCLIMISGKGIFAFVAARSVIGLSYYSIVGLTASYTAGAVSQEKIGYVGGWYKLAFGIGIVVSPMLGALIVDSFGFSAIYRILLVAGLIGVAGVHFLEPVFEHSEKITWLEMKAFLREKKVRGYALITFALSVPAVLFYNYYSVHLELLGYSQVQIGQMYTYVSAGSVIAAILIILWSERIGKMRMAILGLVLCVIFILPLSSANKWILISASLFFGVGYDLIWGLHFPLSSLIYKKGNSTFLTILSLAMAFTNVVTNLFAPLIYHGGGFFWNILLCFASLLLTLVLYLYYAYGQARESKGK